MPNRAIVTEKLGKQYKLGARTSGYRTLGEAISSFGRRPKLRGPLEERFFWSLRNVSFTVNVGQIVGVIGHNGAGKSTLLKLLSRITEPSEGQATIHGRVASLLEVGTGFHPELTGRENIFLNGSILGMERSYIGRRFDEIVDFSEIARFIDTPVKHYSSGMYLRLAFAVAAHLEPEILVVDEVLAVGDAQFQRKCLAKLQDVSRGGRTILFVSHNMAALRNICDRGIALSHGAVVDDGPIADVADRYLASALRVEADAPAFESDYFELNEITIQSGVGPVIKTFDPVVLRVTFTARAELRAPGIYVGILSLDNERLAGLDFRDMAEVPPMNVGQTRTLELAIESLPLLPGSYQLEVHLKDLATHTIERVPTLAHFDVVETPVYGGRQLGRWHGVIGLRAVASHS